MKIKLFLVLLLVFVLLTDELDGRRRDKKERRRRRKAKRKWRKTSTTSTSALPTKPTFSTASTASSTTASTTTTTTKPPLPCGKPFFNPLTGGQTIVGGDQALPHSWPWQVVICHGQSEPCAVKCGGTLISEKWVLTAAHCTKYRTPSELHLKFAAHNFKDAVTNGGPFVRQVKAMYIHPKYTTPSGSGYDISLIELTEPVEYGEKVQPICLRKNDATQLQDGQIHYVTGWGHTEFGGQDSETLLQVDLPVVKHAVCHTAYNGYILDNMFCLGNFDEGGKDSCQNDSGGPAVQLDKDSGSWFQYGVVSFGRKCAEAQYPGVYARVSSACDFIESTVGEKLCRT